MSLFDFFKRKGRSALFSGGPGDSIETAVVINASNASVGVQAEYDYVARQCGAPGRDWRVESQMLTEHEGKPCDVLTVILSNGQVRKFYFDIAGFFGK
jgi:hypothetical protein